MAKFGHGFVRRVVAKCKGLMGRDVGAEWKQTDEKEAGTGWDSRASEEWPPSMEMQATPGWDSRFQPLPDEDDVIKKVNSRDSGYASKDDTPLPDGICAICAIKWLQFPFRTKHYFLTYIQKILEATCLRYARENLRFYLEDPNWKKFHLLFPSGEYPDDRLVGKDWLGDDEIELEYWMRMFADRVPMPRSEVIFGSVVCLRNATVHRGDRGDLDFEGLVYAMALPTFLGVAKEESDMIDAFKYIMEYSNLDDETKTSVEEAIYTPQPLTTHYQALARIQYMLEESCFDVAARRIPHVLTAKGWHIPERVEFQNWHEVFKQAGIENDESAARLFPGLHPGCLLNLHWSARFDIRNIAAHRLPLPDGQLIMQAQRAINIAVLQGDWRRAIEIELLAETHLTKRSRAQVLERLEGVYRNGGVESAYERERRVAIAGVLKRESGSVVGSDEPVVISDTCDVEGLGFETKWAMMMWSPSMWDGLKRVEIW